MYAENLEVLSGVVRLECALGLQLARLSDTTCMLSHRVCCTVLKLVLERRSFSGPLAVIPVDSMFREDSQPYIDFWPYVQH